MDLFGNYTLKEKLKSDTEFALWRGEGMDLSSVLILTPLSECVTQASRNRLEHEYALRTELESDWAVRPLVSTSFDGIPVLVLEDRGGEPLERFIGKIKSVSDFLSIAIALGDSLGKLHARGIIHKDIKPTNVLIDAAGKARLTGFGIASRMLRERQVPAPVEIIAGTFAYMAPEQTGRMNRSVDSRSDLYALGVTYYELLTGVLPFTAADPMEWIHCHLARLPIPPAERVPEIPEMVSSIVMKLLAKTAEDRYQTAEGVVADLQRCLTQWRATGNITPFPLGSHDASDQLLIPEKLYGREEEAKTLLLAFDRVVASGTSELLLVSGYSGIGKSALVNELHKVIVLPRGIFIAGKFDQYKRDIPYATIAQAFQIVIRQILSQSQEQVERWRSAIQQAVGQNGQLMLGLIPELKFLLGPQQPVQELSSSEAQNRFHLVMRQFIGVFARAEHPLVLFLDDLQWLDQGSLKLLEHLVTHPEVRHLLLIGAYRDNEVTPFDPLMLTLETIRKNGGIVTDLVLAALPMSDVSLLITDTLHCTPSRAMPLTQLLHEKTQGNPFFTIQFLTTLHDEGLLEFDRHTAAWRWDIERIRAKGLADNVVGLMIRKLQRLPEATREALKQLACLGNQVSLTTLGMLHERSAAQAEADIDDAVRAGFLVRAGEKINFIHDRIQEAAYALIPKEERAARHIAIGRKMAAQLTATVVEERVFDIVNQLNQGTELITNPDERKRLRQLNFLAGRRAKAATAWASARSYLAQAAALSTPQDWTAHYSEIFALYLELSECEYLVSRFDYADALFSLLLEHARGNPDRSRVYRLRVRLYQVAGRYSAAVDVALEGLRLFGVGFPQMEEKMQKETAAAHQNIPVQLRGREIAELADAPMATDPEVQAVIGLLADATPCAFIARPSLYPLLVLKALNLSLTHGNTEESCAAYSGYSIVLSGIFENIPAAFAFSEMALHLNEKFNDAKLKGRLLYIHGHFINDKQRHIATSFLSLERAFMACVEAGNLIYASFCGVLMVWCATEKGDPLDDVLKVTRKYIAFSRQSHNEAMYLMIRFQEQLVMSLKGLTHEPSSFNDDNFSEEELLAGFVRTRFDAGFAYYHTTRQIASFIYGRYQEALAAAADAAKSVSGMMSSPAEITHHFYYALTLTALYPDAPEAQKREFMQMLTLHLHKLKLWAENCPENYQNRYAMVLAECARIEGRDLDAMRFYEEAIRSARNHGFVQNEGIAHELAARFYRERGFDTISHVYLRNARACYLRWGAIGKVRHLDQHHPAIAVSSIAPASMFNGRAETFDGRAKELDLMTVVKATQAVSGELGLNRLIETLLKIVLEHAGAERGLLILERGEQRIAAEAITDGDRITISLEQAPLTSAALPVSVLHYVMRTRERLLLDNAADFTPFLEDEYMRRMHPKSVFCLPLVKQANVVGAFYLENKLVCGVFTPERVTVLDLLAAQAAIALENAMLYTELQQHRSHLEELVEQRTTDLHQTLTELEQARLAAVTANIAKSRFLAAASHDLRQPMHALNLYLGTIAEERLPEQVRTQFNNARQCARSVDDMFRALLDISKLDSGTIQPKVSVFSIALIFEAIKVQFELEAFVKGLTLRVVPSSACLCSDPAMVERILCNLVANAVRYTERGKILVGCRRKGGMLRLAVYDTGPGIAADQQRAIFDEFFQLDNPERDRTKGLGLGLAIVERLAKLLDAPVTLVSQPGRGSMFAVDLPYASLAEQAQPPALQPITVSRNLAGAFIIVIDDEVAILDATRSLLEQWGYSVITAVSGREALDRLAAGNHKPDAIICDYRLRGHENGIDLIHDLRKKFNDDIPALLITGDTAPARIRELDASGLNWLYKPLDTEQLRGALQELFAVQ